MYNLEGRIDRLIYEISTLIVTQSQIIKNIEKRDGKIDFPTDITSVSDNFTSFNYGDDWSKPGCKNYVLFRCNVTVPDSMDGKKVLLNICTNKGGGHNMIRPQMLLYINGNAVQGLDTNHEHYLLSDNAKAGETYKVHIYAFAGLTNKTPYGGWVDLDETDGVRLYASIQTHSPLLEDLYFNLFTPYMHLSRIDKNSYEYKTILNELNDALNLVDLREPYSDEFYEGAKKANDYLNNGLYAKEYQQNAVATCVGHTHIDVAWLWQYSHTKDKVLRSFATALELIKNNPEYRFMSSQAQLYKYVKEQSPELYNKIKQSIKDGTWEAEGSMWVEPDMNLTSGEYVIRQILYGKKFFKDEFGVNSEVLWLPDVFGYSAALPQILKKCGVNYFMTSKLGTNEKNKFPFDTFSWKGIDGSEILAHLLSYLPNVYNPPIEQAAIYDAWQNYLQKDINEDILVPYGYADGGGGTTQKQIEILKRMKKGIPGVPKVKFDNSANYFKELGKKVIHNRRLPVWSGEIYYEKHRGTYTSMGKVKRQNRKSEIMYTNVEWLWSLANALVGAEFPREQFMMGMENILINQFHDVLPGSCIKEVYQDTDILYNEIFENGKNLINDAIAHFAEKDVATCDKMLVFNPYSDNISGYVEHNGELIYAENVPSKGYGVYSLTTSKPDVEIEATQNRLENKYCILTISDDGYIESLYDKINNRECFIKGEKANRLRIYEDKPAGAPGLYEDNWNLDSFYSEKEFDMPKPFNIELLCNTGEYAMVKIERNYCKSSIVQTIVMYARSPRIDIKTNIDWKEHSQVLKADFPVDVNAIKATYEIQFGHIERPTTKNTSYDEAKFEVCAHKWADISDNGYGVAILNDCKYGYSGNDSTLSLTLLRCGNVPNPDADKECHEFTYSIYPHAGTLCDADVVKEAYMLNNPLFAVDAMPKDNVESYSLFNAKGAVLETIKPAEDGNGVILRLYEPYNRKCRVELTAGKVIKNAVICDMLENDLNTDGINAVNNKVCFDIKPFEIVTLRVIL